MNDTERPYFMAEDDWYYFDDYLGIAKLTDKGMSSPNVVRSYNEYYETQNSGDTILD